MAPIIQAILTPLLASALAGQSEDPADVRCSQPAVSGSSKALYNLAPPTKPGSRSVGELIRTEAESYGSDGRRQRVEWISPDGEVILAFVELYEKGTKPYGALYVEDGELTPTIEAFTWSENDRVKTVEYRKADGTVTGRARYIYDDQDREIKREYGVDGETYSSSDTIVWDGPNEASYTWQKVDNSARSVVVHTIEKVDAFGNWVQRSTTRDGKPTIREVRSLTYNLAGC